MNKINTDTVLLNMLGDPIETQVTPGKPPETLTLKTVLINCLINEADGEKVDEKGKLDRYAIALDIRQGGEVEMNAEQIAMCKKSIAKQFTILVTGQAHRLLEGQPTGLEKTKE